ncbi:MAG: molybdenum ABC transporter ATP-binding protein [Planctomycetota bacterium]
MIEFDFTVERDRFRLEVAGNWSPGIHGLFGPSGSGKSTLLHAIAGSTRPRSGRIRIGDHSVFDASRSLFLPPSERRCGLVFQDARLFPHFDVERNLRYGYPKNGRWITFEEVVELFELRSLLAARPRDISGGEVQRVALGRALLAQPKALLLDEPLAGLDAVRKRQILPFLRQLRDRANIPIVYVTHDLRELLHLTEEITLIRDGVITHRGHYRDLVVEGGAIDVLAHSGLVNVHEGTIETPRTVRLGPAVSDGLVLRIPETQSAVGRTVWVNLRAEDLAIAHQKVDGISIQNQFRARVERISAHERRAIVEVRPSDGVKPLVIEVSNEACETLGLAPGREITCLVKSHAITIEDRDAT